MTIATKNKDIKYAVFVDASGTILNNSNLSKFGVELYPDTSQLLKCLKERNIKGTEIKTGLITNWGSRVLAMLKGLNIENCFDIVLHSGNVEKGKPHSEVFHYACQKLHIKFQNAFHIGDSFDDDALGAQNAGLNGLWLNRSESQNSRSTELNHQPFNNMNDALEFIHIYLTKQNLLRL